VVLRAFNLQFTNANASSAGQIISSDDLIAALDPSLKTAVIGKAINDLLKRVSIYPHWL
jgi:hypothetical protein